MTMYSRWKSALVGEKYHVRSWAERWHWVTGSILAWLLLLLSTAASPCHWGQTALHAVRAATRVWNTFTWFTRGNMKYSFDSLQCLREKFCLCLWNPFFEIHFLKFVFWNAFVLLILVERNIIFQSCWTAFFVSNANKVNCLPLNFILHEFTHVFQELPRRQRRWLSALSCGDTLDKKPTEDCCPGG